MGRQMGKMHIPSFPLRHHTAARADWHPITVAQVAVKLFYAFLLQIHIRLDSVRCVRGLVTAARARGGRECQKNVGSPSGSAESGTVSHVRARLQGTFLPLLGPGSHRACISITACV
jgi:hypothetical protein